MTLAAAALARLSAWNGRRRTESQLRALSDAQLADIGVPRCQIERIARDSAPLVPPYLAGRGRDALRPSVAH